LRYIFAVVAAEQSKHGGLFEFALGCEQSKEVAMKVRALAIFKPDGFWSGLVEDLKGFPPWGF
jgi:hypothetical protein